LAVQNFAKVLHNKISLKYRFKEFILYEDDAERHGFMNGDKLIFCKIYPEDEKNG